MDNSRLLHGFCGVCVGVRILNGKTLISCSVDQRVVVWHQDTGATQAGFPWKWSACCYSNVADVAGLETWLSDIRFVQESVYNLVPFKEELIFMFNENLSTAVHNILLQMSLKWILFFN